MKTCAKPISAKYFTSAKTIVTIIGQYTKLEAAIKRCPARERSAAIVSPGKLHKLNLNRSFRCPSRHTREIHIAGAHIGFREHYSDFLDSSANRESLEHLRMFNETYSYAAKVREASSFFHGLHVKKKCFRDIQIFTNASREREYEFSLASRASFPLFDERKAFAKLVIFEMHTLGRHAIFDRKW